MASEETEKRSFDLYEIQARLIYSVIVAGKSAKFANSVITKWIFLNVHPDELPFDALRRLVQKGTVENSFREAKTGNYGKLRKFAEQIIKADLDLMTCTPDQLEKVSGIGPKTSRFFIMWIRPEEHYAALDVHILRWMARQGYEVPRSTPSRKKYALIEKQFLKEAEKRGKTPRELDLEIWEAGSTAANVIAYHDMDSGSDIGLSG